MLKNYSRPVSRSDNAARLTDYVGGNYQQQRSLAQYDTVGIPYAKDDDASGTS